MILREENKSKLASRVHVLRNVVLGWRDRVKSRLFRLSALRSRRVILRRQHLNAATSGGARMSKRKENDEGDAW